MTSLKVPNLNGCSNFGGIACNGKNDIYCIKTKQDDTVSTIYVFKDGKYKGSRKFTGKMGHGNGLTFHDGKVYVATSSNIIQSVDISKWTRVSLSAPFSIGGIAHYRDDEFLVRSGSKLYILKEDDNVMYKVGSIEIKNPFKENGYSVAQDICYNNGRIYLVYSRLDKKKNCILAYDLKGSIRGSIFSEESPELFEWETACWVDKKTMLIGANTSTGDFIFTKTAPFNAFLNY